jgi:predicted kinase
MGGPGAGKTYWMKNSASLFFKREFQAKQLDSDNNLVVVQRDNCHDLAREIIIALSKESSSSMNTQKETFYKLIETTQAEYDAASEKNGSPKTDLSKIDYKFCKQWADRMDRAAEDQKDRVISEFQKGFEREYFKTVFASDFSKRNISKKQYKLDMVRKLTGMDGTEDVQGTFANDVIVAITGDKIEKIDEIVELAKEMDATVSIVYLNIPEERSIAQDKQRDRSVGADMIRKQLAAIHKTWEELVKVYKDHGIFRMYEMVPGPRTTEKTIAWTPKNQFLNKDMIG